MYKVNEYFFRWIIIKEKHLYFKFPRSRPGKGHGKGVFCWVSLQRKGRSPSKILSVCISMSPYSPSHAFFLDTIKEIYNKDASLFIHLKKVFIYHTVETWGLHEF
jgi:hypothetical protein